MEPRRPRRVGPSAGHLQISRQRQRACNNTLRWFICFSFMPVCARCGKGYEATEPVCPACGAPKDFSPARCGPAAMFAMRFAWAAAFIAAIVCILGGVILVIRGQWLAGLVLILIMAPIGYGQHVALGLAIDYARGS